MDIWFGLIPNVVKRFSHNNFSTFMCKTLALNMEHFLYICQVKTWSLFGLLSRYIVGWYVHTSVSTFKYPTVYLYICMTIHTSLICFAVHPYTPVISGNPAYLEEFGRSCVKQCPIIQNNAYSHVKPRGSLPRVYHLPFFCHRKL